MTSQPGKKWQLEGMEHGVCSTALENSGSPLDLSFERGKPILKTSPDNRGWGDKGYSVKEGYNKFLDTMREHKSSAKWKNV
jgi:hypothetical protein